MPETLVNYETEAIRDELDRMIAEAREYLKIKDLSRLKELSDRYANLRLNPEFDIDLEAQEKAKEFEALFEELKSIGQ